MSSWGRRVCAACGQDLQDVEFSQNQWRKGIGLSRCRVCVQENFDADSASNVTTRSNNAKTANIDYNNIVGVGTFRMVAQGTYTSGQRTGQKCVAKWFKDDAFNFDDFVENDLRAVKMAGRIITQWNESGFIDKRVRLNVPQVWKGPRGKTLVEPYIEDFVKFNSNTGWTSTSTNPWFLVMQALSHYSYHVSSGMYLLCDIQGGIYRDGVILTDPVIQSARQEFGPTDLGREGISTFFSRHRCNQFCRSDWVRPRDSRPFYPAYKGSMYVARHSYNVSDDDSDY